MKIQIVGEYFGICTTGAGSAFKDTINLWRVDDDLVG